MATLLFKFVTEAPGEYEALKAEKALQKLIRDCQGINQVQKAIIGENESV